MHAIHSLDSIQLTVAPQQATELLVYSSIQPGPLNLYAFKAGQRETIYENGSLAYNPSFNSTGQWLLFTSEHEGAAGLYALDMYASIKAPRRLIHATNGMQDYPRLVGDKLIFTSSHTGSMHIYSIDFRPHDTVDISYATQLTQGDEGSNFHPVPSPDGQWIAFTSNRHCQPPFPAGPTIIDASYKAGNIYLMRTDGSDQHQLISSGTWQGSPTWSSNGEEIYFYSLQQQDDKTFAARLHCYDRQKKSVSLVKGLEDREIVSPVFLPNGRLVFVEKQGLKSHLASVDLSKPDLDYKREPDETQDYHAPAAHPTEGWIVCYGTVPTECPFGTGVPPSAKKPAGRGAFFIREQALTINNNVVKACAIRGFFPAITPQADKIVAYEDFNTLYTVTVDEWKPKKLWSVPGTQGMGLSISPDGQWAITAVGRVFDVSLAKHIYKISLNDGSEINLTPQSKHNDTFPAYFPDGRIVFSRACSSDKNLHIMNDDGTEVEQLTFTQGVDSMPVVSPDGNRIAFVSKRGVKDTFNVYMLTKNTETGTWDEQQLTNSLETHAHPKFSPDGGELMFSAGRGGLPDEIPLLPTYNPQPYGDLYVMNLTTYDVERIVASKWETSLADWKKMA